MYGVVTKICNLCICNTIIFMLFLEWPDHYKIASDAPDRGCSKGSVKAFDLFKSETNNDKLMSKVVSH